MSYWVMHTRRAGFVDGRIHHGPSDRLDGLPVYILDAKKDNLGRARAIRRRLGFYSLSLVKEGACWFRCAGRRAVRIGAGQVCAIGPGVMHTWGGRGKSFREDYVAFFGPVADRFHEWGLFDPTRPVMRLREPARLGEIAEILHELFSLEAQLRAGLLLQRVLIDARFAADGAGAKHATIVQDLLELIAKEPMRHLSNESMAASCRMSVSHFRKVFTKEIGMAPGRYCERLRMNRACTRLASSNERITTIAAELGYDDPLYFSKRFRAVIGVSPRGYRRSHAVST